MQDKTYIWILIAVGIICLGAGILIDRHFFAPKLVSVSVKFVPETVDVGPFIARADSLQGVVEQRDSHVSLATRQSAAWRARALRYRQLADSMLAAAESTHTISPLPIKDDVAILSLAMLSDPDSAGRTYNDSLHVEYSKTYDVWQNIYMGVQKRSVQYLREVKETTVEMPYVPWYFWALTVVLVVATAIWG